MLTLVVLGGCDDRALRKPGARASSGVDAAPVPPDPPGYADAATSGQAGTTGPAPAGGQAGAAGQLGTGGSGDTPPPAPRLCDGMALQPLPSAIANDFTSVLVLNSYPSWSVIGQPDDCDQTVFPDLAAVDGGTDAGTDAGSGPDADVPVVASCTAFKYDPDACVAANVDPTMLVAQCWAGVIFEATPGGPSAPGICIAPGARAIHFKARASREGARVKFGSIRAALNETEFFIALTTTWADYTVSIPDGEDYDNETAAPFGGVWDGFSVVAEPQDHVGGTYIFVSDIVWAAQ